MRLGGANSSFDTGLKLTADRLQREVRVAACVAVCVAVGVVVCVVIGVVVCVAVCVAA